MKKRDLRDLLNRAAAALDDPDAITKEERQHLIEDLEIAAREVIP